MKKLGELVGIFAVIFVIFSGIGREADFVGVADVLDDTLIEVSGEEFFPDSIDSSVGGGAIESSKNGRIFIEKNFIDDDLLKISVYAQAVFSPVIGVSFHLKYEPAKVSFVRYEAGNFLETGGKPFYLVKDSPGKNKIYFGETLKKGDTFPTQGGKIVDFYFKILEYAVIEKSDTNAEIGQFGNDVTAKENSKILFSFSNGNVSKMGDIAEKIEDVKFENSEINLSEKDGVSSLVISVLSGVVIFCALILALFLAIKHGKKRAESSVNFK